MFASFSENDKHMIRIGYCAAAHAHTHGIRSTQIVYLPKKNASDSHCACTRCAIQCAHAILINHKKFNRIPRARTLFIDNMRAGTILCTNSAHYMPIELRNNGYDNWYFA